MLKWVGLNIWNQDMDGNQYLYVLQHVICLNFLARFLHHLSWWYIPQGSYLYRGHNENDIHCIELCGVNELVYRTLLAVLACYKSWKCLHYYQYHTYFCNFLGTKLMHILNVNSSQMMACILLYFYFAVETYINQSLLKWYLFFSSSSLCSAFLSSLNPFKENHGGPFTSQWVWVIIHSLTHTFIQQLFFCIFHLPGSIPFTWLSGQVHILWTCVFIPDKI